jgi:hypothetical protein
LPERITAIRIGFDDAAEDVRRHLREAFGLGMCEEPNQQFREVGVLARRGQHATPEPVEKLDGEAAIARQPRFCEQGKARSASEDGGDEAPQVSIELGRPFLETQHHVLTAEHRRNIELVSRIAGRQRHPCIGYPNPPAKRHEGIEPLGKRAGAGAGLPQRGKTVNVRIITVQFVECLDDRQV